MLSTYMLSKHMLSTHLLSKHLLYNHMLSKHMLFKHMLSKKLGIGFLAHNKGSCMGFLPNCGCPAEFSSFIF